MKRTVAGLLVCLFVPSIALADPVRPVGPLPVAPIASVPPLRGPLPVRLCTDPAAASIDYQLVSRADAFSGRVRVVGKVKNVGTAPYVSGPNQQIAQLYEVPAGGRPRLVAQQPFQNLAVGAEVSVSFEMPWRTSIEFPPTYRLVIAYDPDIAIDGNVKNDDCNPGNNVRDRAGSEINRLFG